MSAVAASSLVLAGTAIWPIKRWSFAIIMFRRQNPIHLLALAGPHQPPVRFARESISEPKSKSKLFPRSMALLTTNPRPRTPSLNPTPSATTPCPTHHFANRPF